jgi:hypothetical protein
LDSNGGHADASARRACADQPGKFPEKDARFREIPGWADERLMPIAAVDGRKGWGAALPVVSMLTGALVRGSQSVRHIAVRTITTGAIAATHVRSTRFGG